MIPCIGLASGIGAGNKGCGDGPTFLKEKISFLNWQKLIIPNQNERDRMDLIASCNLQLAQAASRLASSGSFFYSFGGDHSSGVGTWSGVSHALKDQGDIGLIWIDAHMDAHIPETSPSGNPHGMPIASLLGFGDDRLKSILNAHPKLKPENLALVGIRSFEPEEEALLKKLNVRIFYMEEVIEKGIFQVLQEALEIVTKNTIGYGISFDLDSIDPAYVSAVGTPVDNGIKPKQFLEALSVFSRKKPLAFELVEYNPVLDVELKSFEFICQLLSSIQPR